MNAVQWRRTLPTIQISKRQFDALYNYSASYPTGVYYGKLWRSEVEGVWIVRGYVEHPTDTNKARIMQWRPRFRALDQKDVKDSHARYEAEVNNERAPASSEGSPRG